MSYVKIVKNLIYFYYLTISLSSATYQKNNHVLPSSTHHEKAVLHEKGDLPIKDINHKISITFAGARFDFSSVVMKYICTV